MTRLRLAFVLLPLLIAPAVLAQDDGWFARSDRIKQEQPHWITPLATTTPRLEQEFRYDLLWQELGGGRDLTNYGNSKGLELIPFERTEVILSVPPYISRNFGTVADGFGDFSWLVKYRIAAASEQQGNYIATVFLGGTFPSGSRGNGAEHATLAPTFAYGKGWRDFHIQGTFGVSFPLRDTALLGTPMVWNNAFQYRVRRKLWPEIEINSTFFPNGPNSGKKQVFVTPGMVVGRFPLTHRLGLTLGAGVQVAATRFHSSNHNVILSLRLPF